MFNINTQVRWHVLHRQQCRIKKNFRNRSAALNIPNELEGEVSKAEDSRTTACKRTCLERKVHPCDSALYMDLDCDSVPFLYRGGKSSSDKESLRRNYAAIGSYNSIRYSEHLTKYTVMVSLGTR